jgi:hypothetical protein
VADCNDVAGSLGVIHMRGQPKIPSAVSAVAEYKEIFKRVLDNRPSGTRQRLASALGKNRSFISQIANPSYSIPIPAQHLDTIFHLCHFSADEQREFLEAYHRAHPNRRQRLSEVPRTRTLTITVPDLGDKRKNRALDEVVSNFARGLTRLSDDMKS